MAPQKSPLWGEGEVNKIPQTRRDDKANNETLIFASGAALGTLATNTAIQMAGPVTTHDVRLISITGLFSVARLTAGEGNFMYGISSADLSLSELEAYLENNGPLTPSDIVGKEVSTRGRYIRVLGKLTPSGNGGQAADFLKNVSLSGLKIAEDAGGYDFWIYNLDDALSTGATFRVATQIFGKWLP